MKKETKITIITLTVLCCIGGLLDKISSNSNESEDTEAEVVETMADSSDDGVDFISAPDFRSFIGDKSNIGETVRFEAEVSMIFNNEYLLYVRSNNKLYEIRSNVRASDPSLFDGDKIVSYVR